LREQLTTADLHDDLLMTLVSRFRRGADRAGSTAVFERVSMPQRDPDRYQPMDRLLEQEGE